MGILWILSSVSVILLLWEESTANHSVTTLDESERWRQSVAVRLRTRGPDKPFDVLRTRRDSSVTVTFKRAVSRVLNTTGKCKPSRKTRCTLAYKSPGLVGEMHYTFEDVSRRIQGHSAQVLLACRCLDSGCREAIVLEPRRVPSGAELEIDVDFHFPDPHEFSVQLGPNKFWATTGNRRKIRKISKSELERLENITFEEILEDFKKKSNTSSIGEFYVFGNDTAGDAQYPDESAVETGDSEECAKLFDFAQRSAEWMGAQQDQLAIARNEDSFITPRPEEPSSQDAFLAIGTGLTGLLASVGIWANVEHDLHTDAKQRRSKYVFWFWLVLKVLLAIFIVGVEVATLVFAWVSQNKAQNWSSFFTWFDASVALSKPSVNDCDIQKEFFCSAARSVYVVTGLMGTAMSFHPEQRRWKTLLVSMLLIGFASVVFVVRFFAKLYQWWIRNGRRGWRCQPDASFRVSLSPLPRIRDRVSPTTSSRLRRMERAAEASQDMTEIVQVSQSANAPVQTYSRHTDVHSDQMATARLLSRSTM